MSRPMPDINDYQNQIVKLIHEEFLRSEQRNEKTFDEFKLENKKDHEEILDGKEKSHAVILGKIDRSIEVANALASEMRGCYSVVETRQTEYEAKQKLNAYEIAKVVGGITLIMTLLVQYIYEYLTKK